MEEAKQKPNNTADRSGENKAKTGTKQKKSTKKPPQTKKQAQAKRPPQGRPPQGRAPQNGGRRQPPPGYKKKKGGGFSIFLNFLLIIGILAVIAAVYFDVMGFKSLISEVFDIQPLNTPTEGTLAEIEDQNLILQLDIKAKENEVSDIAQKLLVVESDLEDANDKIDDLEDELVVANEAVAGRVEYLEKVAELYEEMDSRKAIGIISKMENIDDIVDILGNMDSAKASAILAGLKADLATQITAEMIK